MDTIAKIHQQLMLWRHLPAAVTAVAMLVLGSTILTGTWQLRQNTRRQMIQHEADLMHSVALMQHLAGQSQNELGGQLENTADQFNLAMQISQLKDVVAARLFDPQGDFLVAFPAYIDEAKLSPNDREALQRLQPVARYDADRTLQDLFVEGFELEEPDVKTASLMEVAIPLHRMNASQLLGVVQFVMDGRRMEREFAALDRNLLWQASLAFLLGGGVISLVLGWSFRKLNRSNALLMERTLNLRRANEALAMAARSSALGAVAAHLLHGLSNPLSGLQDYMVQRREEDEDDDEWRHAMASTRRMRQLVEEATRVLSEESNQDCYELDLDDVTEALLAKCQPVASRQQVTLRGRTETQAMLTNRQANLLSLILENILVNAIQASGKGDEVELRIKDRADGLEFKVTDHGPGIPPEMMNKLFKPCHSGKEGGSGIGLAICQQLANHLGASLSLVATGPQGTTFELQLPLRAPALHSDRVLQKA